MLNFSSILSEIPSTGHAFIVSGKSSFNAENFSVSLTCGKTPNSDIALMISVNLAQAQITRSSLVNGNWVSSETTENLTCSSANPITRGGDFKIYIMIGENKFHVSIDDKCFCEYNFKMAPNSIRAVLVSGDVESVTQADHRRVFPVVYPLVSDTLDKVFGSFIPKKFAPGSVVVVSGVPTGNPDGEFVIMFNEEDCARQLIHLNVRFDLQNVVMNTMNGDDDESWADAEITSSMFPFAINRPFKIAMAFSDSDVKVAVNGQYLMSFSYDQIDLEDGNTLWDILVGFQIKASNNLKVQVTQVEHFLMHSSCNGFEGYSN